MSDLISRQAAIEAIELVDWYHQNSNKDMVHGANDDEHQAWYKADDVYKALEAVPPAEAVPQSEQYKKGFEDAKRAFLLEYARESENMRKRNAQLEVMLNAQKAISADRPRPIDPTYVFDPESGVVPLSACEPKGPKMIIYADRPRGKWIYWRENGIKRCKCSRCLTSYGCLDTPYCPNCGTKMVGERSEGE